MLALFILLGCLLLFATGSTVSTDLFLADMTCRYYAYHLAHHRWDSESARLKEYRRVYGLCIIKIFQPSSIDLLASLFTDAVDEGREVYGQLLTWYAVIAPREPIMRIFSNDGNVPKKFIPNIVRPCSVIVCNGSNGTSFARGESGSLFDEAVLLNYLKDKPDVERIAKRRVIFQRNVIPEATAENVTAFYHQRLARCPSVLPESTLPKKASAVKLRLKATIADYSPGALGANFVTEFGLLYHLNRSSSLVDNDDKMLEGLRSFFPGLIVTATLPYVPKSGSHSFMVPWAPPFHPIHPHQPRVLQHLTWYSDDLWGPITDNFDEIVIPSYSKRSFIVCQLGPTRINRPGSRFAVLAKVILKDPPHTSDRRLLIAHLLRTEYSSDILDPSTKQRYDSLDWYFGGRSFNEYVERAKKERAIARKSAEQSSSSDAVAKESAKPISGGLIVAKQRDKVPTTREQSSTAQGGLVSDAGKGNALLKNVDSLPFLMKHALDREIGTDENILEAIAAANGAPLGFLFSIAPPEVLGTLAKQDERPMIKRRAEEALAVHEQLLNKCIKNYSAFYDGITELIGGITTLGEKRTCSPYLTDGVYADVLVNPDIDDSWFQLLLDEARPVAIELGFNRCSAKCRASPRCSALKGAYDECVKASLAHRTIFAQRKNEDVSFDGGAQLMGSFLKPRSVLDEEAAESSTVDSFDLSSLEPVKVHLTEGIIPEEIIELATGRGLEPGKLVEGSKLTNVQVQQIRPYGPALVTYIYEQELDIEVFLARSGLYSDYKTFVAFMDVYGPTLRSAVARKVVNGMTRVFGEFHKALGDRSLLRALFSVRNFYAALMLFDRLKSDPSYHSDLLRFLATETRFPLDAFSTMSVDMWLDYRSLTIRVICTSDVCGAAERNDLEYLHKHLFKVNISTHKWKSILLRGPKIPLEAFNLILSVFTGVLTYSDRIAMTPEQRKCIERHFSLTDRLEEACEDADLDTIRTLLADVDCTPGIHVHCILAHLGNEAVLGVLMERVSDFVRKLVLAQWMSLGARQDDERMVAIVNRCRQP